MTQEAQRDVQACRDGIRVPKAHLQLNLTRHTKGNKKDFYRYISNKREDKGKCASAAEWGRGLGDKGCRNA